MKISRLISAILLGVALVAFTPAYAQRGGGGRSGGSSSHSSGSRGGGSFSSSRGSSSSFSSSSSRSSSSFSRSSSSPSRSSSSSRSSFSSSSNSSSRLSDISGSSSSSNFRSSSSYNSGSGRGSGRSSSLIGNDAPAHVSRTGSVPTQGRGSQTGMSTTGRGDAARTSNAQLGNGRPSGTPPEVSGGGSHPHPHPHPSPYFMHPHHHHMVHCHQLYWDPCPPRHLYWPGFWVYCDSYWYDYYVTDLPMVRSYIKETYKMELVTYAISGDYMYALVSDPNGHTYLQIYDKNDKLLAEQQVSHKYIKMEIDAQNGGCWIMKKRDRDPLLFLYADGQLLIYEADK